MAELSDLGLGKLVRRIGSILTQQLSVRFLQVAIAVYLAHALGVQAFGQYSIAILWPIVLAHSFTFGVPTASVYALSRGGSLVAAIRWNLLVGSGLLAAGAALSLAVIVFAAQTLFPGVSPGLLLIAAGGFPATIARTFASGLLRGRQDFQGYNIEILTGPLINMLAVLVLVGWAGASTGGAVAAWALGEWAAFIAGCWFVRRLLAAEDQSAAAADRRPPSFGYGLKSHLSNIQVFLNYRIDIFLVNFFLGPANAGIYTAAVRLAEQLWMVPTATAVVLLPRLAELHRAEDVRRRLTPLIARWVTLITLLMAGGLAVVAGRLIELLFGPGFAPAGEVLLWLLPGIVVFSCGRTLAHDLAARGRPDANAWVAIIALSVNLVGNLVLIPPYGVIGAALATTLAYGIATAVTFFFYERLSSHRIREVFRVGQVDRDVLARAMTMVRRSR